MKVYTSLEDFKAVTNPILTAGTFDGVHIGHQKIIDRLQVLAKQHGGETVLMTFFPHPRMVLFPDDNDLKLLNTKNEKIELLEKAGIDHLIIFPFTKEFSRLTAVEYVRDVLVNLIGVHTMVIGYDHQFGRNREGNLQNLQELAGLYDFNVEEISAQDVDEVNVSSTKIRQALLEGDVQTSMDYLGHAYSFSGFVERGNQLGRSIGFPTANLNITDNYKLIPGMGVYAVRIQVEKVWYAGMLNIGIKPTINSENTRTSIEVHLFDFNQEIYEQFIKIELVARIRNERTFEDLSALKEQLKLDKIKALNLLA